MRYQEAWRLGRLVCSPRLGFVVGYWWSSHGDDLIRRAAAWSNPGWDGRFHQGAGKPAQSERWKAKKLEDRRDSEAGH